MHLSRRGAIDDDHDVAGRAAWSPEPVAVVTADGCGQTVAKEVDRAGFAVVGAINADLRLVLRRQRVVDSADLIDLLLPAKAVGVELRQRPAGFVFCVVARRYRDGALWYRRSRWRAARLVSPAAESELRRRQARSPRREKRRYDFQRRVVDLRSAAPTRFHRRRRGSDRSARRSSPSRAAPSSRRERKVRQTEPAPVLCETGCAEARSGLHPRSESLQAEGSESVFRGRAAEQSLMFLFSTWPL